MTGSGSITFNGMGALAGTGALAGSANCTVGVLGLCTTGGITIACSGTLSGARVYNGMQPISAPIVSHTTKV